MFTKLSLAIAAQKINVFHNGWWFSVHGSKSPKVDSYINCHTLEPVFAASTRAQNVVWKPKFPPSSWTWSLHRCSWWHYAETAQVQPSETINKGKIPRAEPCLSSVSLTLLESHSCYINFAKKISLEVRNIKLRTSYYLSGLLAVVRFMSKRHLLSYFHRELVWTDQQSYLYEHEDKRVTAFELYTWVEN